MIVAHVSVYRNDLGEITASTFGDGLTWKTQTEVDGSVLEGHGLWEWILTIPVDTNAADKESQLLWNHIKALEALLRDYDASVGMLISSVVCSAFLAGEKYALERLKQVLPLKSC